MTEFKRIFRFYVFGNFHVAVSSACLCAITGLEFGFEAVTISIFVGLSTFLSYHLIRTLRIRSIEKEYAQWLRHHLKVFVLLNLMAIFALVYLVFKLHFRVILLLIPLFFLTVLYGSNFNFRGHQLGLRKIIGLKLFLIGFIWACSTVWLPIVQSEIPIERTHWISFIQRFFFVVAITIPFDIRDLTLDPMELRTLPQIFGLKKSKGIGMIFLVLFFILELIKNEDQQHIWITALILMISSILMLGTTPQKGKYYAAFWIEAIPVLWFLLLFFLKD